MKVPKKNGLPVSIFEQVMLLVMGTCFPFMFIVHSGFSEDVKSILFFLLLSTFIGIISRIFYRKKKQRFALELILFYGGLNLFLGAVSIFVVLVRIVFFPESFIISSYLEATLTIVAPIIGFLFAYISLKYLVELNQNYDEKKTESEKFI